MDKLAVNLTQNKNNTAWRNGWEQIGKFLKNGTTDIISTGYEPLDKILGGGFAKGTTNLVIEDSGCQGHVLLAALLKNRIELGDVGLIDCFFISPDELKKHCSTYNIDISRYDGNLYFIDFSSRRDVKALLGSDELDTFAQEYAKVVSNLIPKGEIFSITLSLSASAMRYGEGNIYEHLRKEKKEYESYGRTAVHLVERNVHTQRFINGLKELADSVIVLKSISYGDSTKRFLQVKKAPLPNYSSSKLEYELVPEMGVMIANDKITERGA